LVGLSKTMTDENSQEVPSVPDDAAEAPAETVDDTRALFDAVQEDLLESSPFELGEPEAAESEAREELPESDPVENTDHTSDRVPAEVQDSIDRRIGKEVSKRKAVEDQLEDAKDRANDLERKLAESRQPQISLSENSYDGKPLQELVDEEQKLRNFCRWAEEGALYDGHEFEDANGEFVRHEPETIRKHYSSAKEALEQSIPEARAKAETMVGVQQDIARKWPELVSVNGGKAKASYEAILAEPYFAALLKARPQAAYLAAHAVLGVKADQSKVRRAQAGNGSRNAAAPSLPTDPGSRGASSLGPRKKGSTGLTPELRSMAADGDLDSVIGALMGE
jgi:hypothetical protein